MVMRHFSPYRDGESERDVVYENRKWHYKCFIMMPGKPVQMLKWTKISPTLAGLYNDIRLLYRTILPKFCLNFIKTCFNDRATERKREWEGEIDSETVALKCRMTAFASELLLPEFRFSLPGWDLNTGKSCKQLILEPFGRLLKQRDEFLPLTHSKHHWDKAKCLEK